MIRIPISLNMLSGRCDGFYVFGAVEFVAAEGVNGELGFVTEEMTEAAYEEKAAKLADILQMIRVK